MYVLSPNSLGVRQTAIIVGEFQHVRTFTELIQHHRDGNNRRKFQHVHTFSYIKLSVRQTTFIAKRPCYLHIFGLFQLTNLMHT